MLTGLSSFFEKEMQPGELADVLTSVVIDYSLLVAQVDDPLRTSEPKDNVRCLYRLIKLLQARDVHNI